MRPCWRKSSRSGPLVRDKGSPLGLSIVEFGADEISNGISLNKALIDGGARMGFSDRKHSSMLRP